MIHHLGHQLLMEVENKILKSEQEVRDKIKELDNPLLYVFVKPDVLDGMRKMLEWVVKEKG